MQISLNCGNLPQKKAGYNKAQNKCNRGCLLFIPLISFIASCSIYFLKFNFINIQPTRFRKIIATCCKIAEKENLLGSKADFSYIQVTSFHLDFYKTASVFLSLFLSLVMPLTSASQDCEKVKLSDFPREDLPVDWDTAHVKREESSKYYYVGYRQIMYKPVVWRLQK